MPAVSRGECGQPPRCGPEPLRPAPRSQRRCATTNKPINRIQIHPTIHRQKGPGSAVDFINILLGLITVLQCTLLGIRG